MMSKSLNTILEYLSIKPLDHEVLISDLSIDSRDNQTGGLFIALAGEQHHGINFAHQAQDNGAHAILSEPYGMEYQEQVTSLKIPVIVVKQLNKKAADIAMQFYDHPSQQLTVIGITGTNGKTSSAWLLLQAWQHLGIKGAYIGTLGYGTLNTLKKLDNTTPPALVVQKILAQFVCSGITHVAMEVSSHGIALKRIKGLKLTGAALTNISRDHLDFHHTMEAYANTKKKLFTDENLNYSVINRNDAYGRSWIDQLKANVSSFAIDDAHAELNVTQIKLSLKGTEFTANHKGETYQLFSPLLARFNVENVLLVISLLLQEKHEWKDIITAIENLTPVPGRMNTLDKHDHAPLVIVDYAHTPDALEQVLITINQHQPKNIWCIFGCGGDRDPGKRPLMGKVAEKLAYHCIITDDNPRTEDSNKIITDILKGMNGDQITVMNDRKSAISFAIDQADEDDVVLIAGKGHENTQQIGMQFHPFDDRLIASKILSQAGSRI